MDLNNQISWTVCASVLALHLGPASAQIYLDDAGDETSAPTETEMKPEKKDNADAKLENSNHVVFFERTAQAIRGASSDQEVFFSATKVKEHLHVSFKLNGKEFLFVYGSISLKNKTLHRIQLAPDGVGQNKKTKEDDDVLTLLFLKLEKDINRVDPLEEGILSSLDLLINMIPRDEPFDKLDVQGAK